MVQVVEPLMRQASRPKQRLEPARHGDPVKGCPDRGAEHEVTRIRMPACAGRLLLHQLPCLVRLQGLKHEHR